MLFLVFQKYDLSRSLIFFKICKDLLDAAFQDLKINVASVQQSQKVFMAGVHVHVCVCIYCHSLSLRSILILYVLQSVTSLQSGLFRFIEKSLCTLFTLSYDLVILN
jgi:hypothetical protein